MKKKVLVFPCGSEVGLEINRCLRNSRHFDLYGASSVNDHGRFVYDNYIGGLPTVDKAGFKMDLSSVAIKNGIDYIIPANDKAILALMMLTGELRTKVLVHSEKTCRVCFSKDETYYLFDEISPKKTSEYPKFVKPIFGSGSKGCFIIRDETEESFLKETGRLSGTIVREFLHGDEYTVDCFTDRFGRLRFCEGRCRSRVNNGISVETRRADKPYFRDFAEYIMDRLDMRGVWFFQVKEDIHGDPALLEIAPRIAGSSGLWRAYGVNLIETALFDMMLDTETPERRFRIDTGINVCMSRALDTVFGPC